MSKWSNFYLNICMLNNILMPVNFGTGHLFRLLLLLFSVDSVWTHSAFVVGLDKFGSVTAFRQNQIN